MCSIYDIFFFFVTKKNVGLDSSGGSASVAAEIPAAKKHRFPDLRGYILFVLLLLLTIYRSVSSTFFHFLQVKQTKIPLKLWLVFHQDVHLL